MKFLSLNLVVPTALFYLVGQTLVSSQAPSDDPIIASATTTVPTRDIGRFEIRSVGTAGSTTEPIAIINSVSPMMKGTIFFEYNPETATRIGGDPKLILYGMFNVGEDEISSEPCSKATGAVRIADNKFSQTFLKEEDLEDGEKYMQLYSSSIQNYPRTTSGKIGHFVFDNLDLGTADETVTDGQMVKICARVVQATDTVTYSSLDTIFSIQRSYRGEIDLALNLEAKQETGTIRLEMTSEISTDAATEDIERIVVAAVQVGLNTQRRSLIANRILSETSVAASCSKRNCAPNFCYDCTVSVVMALEALADSLAKFDPDTGSVDLQELFQEEITQDAAFEDTVVVGFTNKGATVIDGNMGYVIDTDANIIEAETYLCDIQNNAKIDTSSASQPLSIGQDFKICVKPEAQTNNLFKYQTTGFRSVSCDYTTDTDGDSSQTLVDGNGIATAAHTLIDPSPDSEGILGFVTMVLPPYLEANNKAINCQGIAVIENVRATRRLVDQERSNEISASFFNYPNVFQGTIQSVFYEHHEDVVDIPLFSSLDQEKYRGLQETVQRVSFAPRIQSATDFSLEIVLDSSAAPATRSLLCVGLAAALSVIFVAFL